MSDLIDRQAAYEVLTSFYHHNTDAQHMALQEALNKVPSADVDLSGFSDKLWAAAYERGKAEAERHGHWIYTPTNILGYVCSECGKTMCRFNYCPNCGARME